MDQRKILAAMDAIRELTVGEEQKVHETVRGAQFVNFRVLADLCKNGVRLQNMMDTLLRMDAEAQLHKL